MSRNNSRKDLELRRRETVGRLRARQMTFREIVVALAKEPEFWNQQTGKPYSIRTVHADVKWCEQQWRDHCIKSIEEHKSRMLNEIAEVKRQGYSEKDLAVVIRALAKECDVIGLNAPTRIAGADGGPLVPRRIELVFTEPRENGRDNCEPRGDEPGTDSADPES